MIFYFRPQLLKTNLVIGWLSPGKHVLLGRNVYFPKWLANGWWRLTLGEVSHKEAYGTALKASLLLLLLLADSKLHKLETGTLAFKVKVATFDKHQLLQLLRSLFLIFITLFALFTTALEQLLLFTDKTFSMQAIGEVTSVTKVIARMSFYVAPSLRWGSPCDSQKPLPTQSKRQPGSCQIVSRPTWLRQHWATPLLFRFSAYIALVGLTQEVIYF